METVDWAALAGDAPVEDNHVVSLSQEKQTTKTEPALPAGFEKLDPETSVRTVVKYEWLPAEELKETNGKYNAQKVTYKFKVERKKILQCVARRKHLKKFGVALNDPPGPNPRTTSVKEEVSIKYLRGYSNIESTIQPTKDEGRQIQKFTCSHCGLDHQTTTCPSLNRQPSAAIANMATGGASVATVSPLASATPAITAGGAAKYVIPSLRGSQATTSSLASNTAISSTDGSKSTGQMPEEPTIRVTNLPSETREQDLRDLFGSYGHITRVFVPRDPITRDAKGYAFITFDRIDDARTAARLVNNYNYANMALNVELVQKPRASRY